MAPFLEVIRSPETSGAPRARPHFPAWQQMKTVCEAKEFGHAEHACGLDPARLCSQVRSPAVHWEPCGACSTRTSLVSARCTPCDSCNHARRRITTMSIHVSMIQYIPCLTLTIAGRWDCQAERGTAWPTPCTRRQRRSRSASSKRRTPPRTRSSCTRSCRCTKVEVVVAAFVCQELVVQCNLAPSEACYRYCSWPCMHAVLLSRARRRLLTACPCPNPAGAVIVCALPRRRLLDQRQHH